MKRFFSVLLVAALVASTAFAGLTGSVSTSAGYNFDKNEYGFFDVELKNAELTVALGEDGVTTEIAEDATVYASVKASLAINAKIGEDKFDTENGAFTGSGDVNLEGVAKTVNNLTYTLKLEEAKVGGKLADQDWYVGLLSVPSAPAMAKSYLDLDDDGKLDDTYEIPYFKANGITAGFAGYETGFGFHAKKGEGTSMSIYAATPEYTLIDGLTVQAAAAYSHRGALDNPDEKTTDYGKLVYAPGEGNYNYNEGKLSKVEDGEGNYKIDWQQKTDKYNNEHNLGGSVKFAYASELFSASLASDMGVYGLTNDKTFGMDLLANAKYDFVSSDVYYALTWNADDAKYDNTLHAQINTDLNAFNVPFTLGLGMKNIIADNRAMTAKLGFAGWGATANFTSEFGFTKDAAWKIGFDASYDIMGYATVKGAVSYNNKEMLGVSISAETESIIPGATLALGWYDAQDLLGKNTEQKLKDTYWVTGKTDADNEFGIKGVKSGTLLKDKYTDKGVIKASCTIKF